jgi:hypothetical protein
VHEGGIQLAWPSEYNATNFGINTPMTDRNRANSDVERHWYRNLANFTEVEAQPKILATWLVGEAAKMADKLDDEEVTKV